MIKARNFALALFLAACLYAQAPTSDESVWKTHRTSTGIKREIPI